jgi:hypothetical protein
MTDENLGSWDDFTGSDFLTAPDVKNEDHEFVCTGLEFDRENLRPILVLDSGEELKGKKFSLNVTNSKFIKEAGVDTPKACIGKKLKFKKVLVNNPQTKKEVESLRIRSVA